MVAFVSAQTESQLSQVRTWKGVDRAEPFLQVPVKLIHGDKNKVGVIFGVDPNTRLLNPTSYDGSRMSIPKTGIIIGDALMERLGLTLGQRVTITLPQKTVPELAISPELDAPTSNFRLQVFSRSRGLQEITFRKQCSS